MSTDQQVGQQLRLAGPLTFRQRAGLIALLGFAAVVNLALIHLSKANSYDDGNISIAVNALRAYKLHFYDHVQEVWPYPPGYLPVGLLAQRLPFAFSTASRLFGAVADMALAWLVQEMLGWRGVTFGRRMIAAGLLALGPCVLATSVVHGQIDVVATLFAVAGYAAWERLDGWQRPALTGLLIGIGADIKLPAGLAALSLVALTCGWRERARLVGWTALVPVVTVAPFALVTPRAARIALTYHGLPGVGGLSLLVQPAFALAWYHNQSVALSSLEKDAMHVSGDVTVAAILLVMAACWRWRPAPAIGASLMYLAVYVFGVNYLLQYVVWILPFLLLAGLFRTMAGLQALYLVPLWFRYHNSFTNPPENAPLIGSVTAIRDVYVPAMALLWLFFLVLLTCLLWQSATRRARIWPP